MSSTPLFSKRHYEWLARWAGENLSQEQTFGLSCDLSRTSEAFKHETFMRAARNHRENVKAFSVQS